MAAKEECLKVWLDYEFYFEEYNDEEVGRLVRAMLIYRFEGLEPNFEGRERYIWSTIKHQIDEDVRIEKGRKTYGNIGEYHWNWKGGVTPKNQVDRNSARAHEWRKAVFDRDCYTCQICGQVGGKLNAHHIKPWAKFPALRFDVDNGITLCENCHKNIHKRCSKHG